MQNGCGTSDLCINLQYLCVKWRINGNILKFWHDLQVGIWNWNKSCLIRYQINNVNICQRNYEKLTRNCLHSGFQAIVARHSPLCCPYGFKSGLFSSLMISCIVCLYWINLKSRTLFCFSPSELNCTHSSYGLYGRVRSCLLAFSG